MNTPSRRSLRKITRPPPPTSAQRAAPAPSPAEFSAGRARVLGLGACRSTVTAARAMLRGRHGIAVSPPSAGRGDHRGSAACGPRAPSARACARWQTLACVPILVGVCADDAFNLWNVATLLARGLRVFDWRADLGVGVSGQQSSAPHDRRACKNRPGGGWYAE